ncbi:MAG: HD domain-containing protein [Lachnospiraceae bacterium]|nr:HD domain-containing protein [Lachnospiraceae bacterium]
MNPIYSVMILICILSMLTMSVLVRKSVTLTNKTKMWFIITFIGISFGMTAEFLRTVLDANPISNELYRLITLAEFCITPMLPIPLSLACGIKKPAVFASLFMLVHIVLEVVLVNTGAVFYVDGNGTYHRGDYYVIYISSYVISLLYLISIFYFISRRFRNRNLFILIASLVVIFAGILPSVMEREIKTAFLGMTFMAIILYNYFEDLTQQDIANDLAAQNERIKALQAGMIIGIANLIESRDSSTGTHVKNTSNYVSMLAHAAKEAGIYPDIIDENFIQRMISAAPLHDIGKISVPDHILQKPGKLTEEEFEIMKTHTTEGGKMIYQVIEDTSDEEFIKVAYDVAAYHHEKWNGNGYPVGLAGEDIPVSARIMAIADVYDALTMERVYKKPFPVEKALSIIETDAGSHFDPVLAPLFVEMMRKKLNIY